MTAEQIISIIPTPNNERSGDYRQDGLLYCGECHAPKEVYIPGIDRTMPTPCKCADIKAELEREAARLAEAEKLRAECLPLAKMRKHTFKAADNSKAVKIARKYADNWQTMSAAGDGLIFWGTVGVGKSFAAHCVANALIDEGIRVLYLSSADMVAEFSKSTTGRKEYLDKLCAAPLLIVDDLGAESNTDYSRSLLCRLIDARTESGKPIIVTTNYTLAEMEGTQDPQLQRIFDRLRCCTPVQCVGESRRKDNGAERLERAKRLLLDE